MGRIGQKDQRGRERGRNWKTKADDELVIKEGGCSWLPCVSRGYLPNLLVVEAYGFSPVYPESIWDSRRRGMCAASGHFPFSPLHPRMLI